MFTKLQIFETEGITSIDSPAIATENIIIFYFYNARLKILLQYFSHFK